jgi:VIT1/CCC1 family predicted Fe2+/Mn2+ transporter
MGKKPDAKRYRDNLQSEVDSTALYRALAEIEKRPEMASVYARLAEVEQRHVKFWEAQIKAAGVPVPVVKPSWRSRVLSGLARRFGPEVVLPTVIGKEKGATADYTAQPESRTSSLPAEEGWHRRVLTTALGAARGGIEGASVARLEGRHRAVGGNTLRAGVLGINDGLLSTLSLVMGVAGAALTNQQILITGLAGLLAGSISMALGEWLSVQNSRELYGHQLQIEADELETTPKEEEAELALIYQAKGLPEDEALALAARLISDPDTALDTLAREELGIDPADLGGSPWQAAFTSFFLFACGAVVPIVPFLFNTGRNAPIWSAGLSIAALFGIGALTTVMTGRNLVYSGIRQMLFGAAAAGLTYGIGWLLGVQVLG